LTDALPKAPCSILCVITSKVSMHGADVKLYRKSRQRDCRDSVLIELDAPLATSSPWEIEGLDIVCLSPMWSHDVGDENLHMRVSQSSNLGRDAFDDIHAQCWLVAISLTPVSAV
jgi:hypothetical protein